MRLAILALLLAPLPLTPARAQDAPERAFTGSDLFKLEAARDPQPSPDGRTIAYVRQAGDVMSDRNRTSIWLVDVATGRQRPLVTGSGSYVAPRWSPDGTRLAFTAIEDGGTQLWVRWIDSGAAAKLTNLPDSPGSVTWAPDGRNLAYVMRVPGDGAKLGKAPPKPEGAKWAEPLEVIDRVTYRGDGAGYYKPGYSHIFTVSADGGAPRQLTFGSFDDDGPLSFTPDGRTVLFSAVRKNNWEREPNDSEVMALDLGSGAIRALTTRFGPDAAPIASPDGSKIAWLGFDDKRRTYENTELYVMNRDGTGQRNLTGAMDISIDDAQWAPDGKSLLAAYDDHGVKLLSRIGLDGSRKPLARGLSGAGFDRPYTGGEFKVGKNGMIAWTAGSCTRPPDVHALRAGQDVQLTRLNDTWIGAKALGQAEKVAVTAPDGRPIDAWLMMPPGAPAGSKVPMILEIHGGPHTAYGPWFSTDYQLYAAGGYAVLWTNPRGSTSYGEAFAKLIDRAYPGEDYGDLMAAVDAAIATGTIDANNLFVTGGSGGGILTAWIVGKTDRFRAAATQKPVINWASEALTMDNTTHTSRYWFDNPPWVDVTSYWQRSPLSLVGNVKTPTLVVVGSEDYRTPVSESEQYYTALQIAGVPTALVKVPGASHGGFTARPSQSAGKASAILAWFDRYRVK
ncbi:dipeptidyl aminopeptidase/acylaminoacyl peptidase [Novosphingobium kunmingense]|uniref:Dipeptidyl aminopeptidase/acylaminoacyl peptidase n=1 Tax=Novosphingobium kunmingense TaxID=1211806 RepID=A0A2N0I3Q9_9SPHN|nr:S9 family peptidase [Novosphingobium kunmingense]PKB25829.1 dipeptidyl aminopeptidase/acylaminoacyl peptidase [Novosphingobium kunmingense]